MQFGISWRGARLAGYSSRYDPQSAQSPIADLDEAIGKKRLNMTLAPHIPETFLGIGYTRHRAGLPLETVRVPVPKPADDQILVRVAASSLNPLEYKLADLNFMGRTPPVVLGLDLAGVVVAVGQWVSGVAVGDAVAAMADLNGDGGWVATGGSGGEGGYALAREFLTVPKPESLSFLSAAALPMCFLSAFASLYGTVQAGDTVYIPGGGGGVRRCRASRRADGRARLGGRLGHQQRQYATIDGAGPAVWRALRFRLQARRHRRRNLKADRWPGRRPCLRCHLQ